MRRLTPKRQTVFGDCPNNQTLCQQIARDRENGDAIGECPLCHTYMHGKGKPHFPVPAIRYKHEWSLDSVCRSDDCISLRVMHCRRGRMQWYGKRGFGYISEQWTKLVEYRHPLTRECKLWLEQQDLRRKTFVY